MRQHEPSRAEDTSRDPWLEAAFTHFVQQAQAPAAFAAQVRAQVALLGPEGPSGAWHRRVAIWLRRGGVSRWGPGTGMQEESWRPRPRPGRVQTVGLVTCLGLSVLGNVWLGVRLVRQAGPLSRSLTAVAPPAQDAARQPAPDAGGYRTLSDETRRAPPGAAEPAQETRGRFWLVFAGDLRQQELLEFLHRLRATIIAGPTRQGVYTVLVPLPRLPERPSDAGASELAAAQQQVLAELRAHPSVRFAEPVPLP